MEEQRNSRKMISSLQVKGLLGIKDLNWNLKKVNVLVGRNGAGKSTIVNLLNTLLCSKSNGSVELCESAKITFNDESSITLENIGNSISQTLSEFKNIEVHLSKIFQDNKRKSKKTIDSELTELKSKIYFLNEFYTADNNKFKLVNFEYNKTTAEEISSNIDVEFISTINMNANSVNEVKKSDGEKTTILDMEISKEISRFNDNRDCEDEVVALQYNALFNVLNRLLKDSNKSLKFENNNFVFWCENRNEKLTFEDLSSGERQLVYILLKVVNSKERNSIFLMDEPEISLHLSWQESLISSILEINKNCQIIIVTHSPALVMDGWMDSYIDIDSISKVRHVKF